MDSVYYYLDSRYDGILSWWDEQQQAKECEEQGM
jgi:hypothetical protein